MSSSISWSRNRPFPQDTKQSISPRTGTSRSCVYCTQPEWQPQASAAGTIHGRSEDHEL